MPTPRSSRDTTNLQKANSPKKEMREKAMSALSFGGETTGTSTRMKEAEGNLRPSYSTVPKKHTHKKKTHLKEASTTTLIIPSLQSRNRSAKLGCVARCIRGIERARVSKIFEIREKICKIRESFEEDCGFVKRGLQERERQSKDNLSDNEEFFF